MEIKKFDFEKRHREGTNFLDVDGSVLAPGTKILSMYQGISISLKITGEKGNNIFYAKVISFDSKPSDMERGDKTEINVLCIWEAEC